MLHAWGVSRLGDSWWAHYDSMHLHHMFATDAKLTAISHSGEKALAGPIANVANAISIIAAVAGTVGPIGFFGIQFSFAFMSHQFQIAIPHKFIQYYY